MPETTAAGYLSIGEVLSLLLEEFPDITISKIRFLESQGLISPERTSSGYRKFYDDDVQRLRVILTEQHANYLPLRVIKDRLASGEIDATGEHLRPNGALTDDDSHELRRSTVHAELADGDDDHTPAEISADAIRAHPASGGKQPTGDRPSAANPTTSSDEPSHSAAATDSGVTAAARPSARSQPLPGVRLDRGELLAMAGMTDAELTALESFGVVVARPEGDLYDDDAVAIAKPACELLRIGVDARHLRTWRTSAEREVGIFEQLVIPRLRQRNPEARAEAVAQLKRLDTLGAELRASLTRHALSRYLDP